MKAIWSKPHHGVQHITNTKRGFRITATALSENVVTCYIVLPGGAFTPAGEETFDSVPAAEAWGEQIAAQFDALT